jgi:hypothetical protein
MIVTEIFNLKDKEAMKICSKLFKNQFSFKISVQKPCFNKVCHFSMNKCSIPSISMLISQISSLLFLYFLTTQKTSQIVFVVVATTSFKRPRAHKRGK